MLPKTLGRSQGVQRGQDRDRKTSSELFIVSFVEGSVAGCRFRSLLPGTGRRRRARVGASGQPGEGHLGGIFHGVVDVLAIIPIPSCKDKPVDGDTARPSSSPTYPKRKDKSGGSAQVPAGTVEDGKYDQLHW